jgi:hypothetical protein
VSNPPDSLLPQITLESRSMFRSLFLEKCEDDADEDDLTLLNNRLVSLMEEGARTVPPASITSWAVGELSQGLAKVVDVTEEFTENSPHYFSPLEEIGRDCGRLEKELTREHVRLYKENEKLSGEVDAAAKDRTTLNQQVVSYYHLSLVLISVIIGSYYFQFSVIII